MFSNRHGFTNQRAHNGVQRLVCDQLVVQDNDDPSGKVLQAIDASGQLEYVAIPSLIDTPKLISVSENNPNTGTLFSTVTAAVAYVITQSPNAFNVFLIEVDPGVYFEPGQISIPEYVYIRGKNRNSTTLLLVAPLAAGEGFIEITNANSNISDITIVGNELCDYAIRYRDPAGTIAGVFLFRCVLLGANVANFYVADSGNLIFFVFCIFLRTNAVTQYGMFVENGAQVGSIGSVFQNVSDPGNGIGVYMKNTQVPTDQFRNQPSTSAVAGFATGWLLENSNATWLSGDFSFNLISIDMVNSSVVLNSLPVNAITTNIRADATSQIYTNAMLFDIAKLQLDPATVGSIQYIEESIDNQIGWHILGNLTVGDKIFPATQFSGEGAYNYTGVSYLIDDLGGFFDATEDLKPSSGINVNVFAGNGVFYIGDSHKFSAIEYNTTANGGGQPVVEYWNGTAWATVNVMVTQGVLPYGSYADQLFNGFGMEDVRFDIRLQDAWMQTTVDGVLAYWIRLRVGTLVIPYPAISSLRNIYSTTKTEANGVTLRYGLARAYKSVVLDINTLQGTSGPTRPVDVDLFLGENSRLGRTSNGFGVGNIAGFTFFVPNDLDSSSPVFLYLSYVSDNAAASQVDFQIQLTIGTKSPGNLVYFTQGDANGNSIENQIQQTVNLPVNATNGTAVQIVPVELEVPFLISRDINSQLVNLLSFDLERIADGNANELVFTQISLIYLSFTDGITLI